MSPAGKGRLQVAMNGDILNMDMRHKYRIYLDVCCLNRPFDDQEQDRVRLEAEAVKSVLFHIGMGQWLGVRSDVIDFEIDRISDPDRHLEVASILVGFQEFVLIGEPEHRRGLELERWGFGPTDALHVACGEKARVEVLLTTDDHLLRKANQYAKELAIRVANPLTWLEEVFRK